MLDTSELRAPHWVAHPRPGRPWRAPKTRGILQESPLMDEGDQNARPSVMTPPSTFSLSRGMGTSRSTARTAATMAPLISNNSMFPDGFPAVTALTA